MYLCTRRKIWTSFSCLFLLKCYHVVFSQFKIPANLAQLAVSKMHCLYANAVVQPSVQHCPCYMAWKTKVHTWCRHCHLCTNAPMWREKRWLQGIIDPPSYSMSNFQTCCKHVLCNKVSFRGHKGVQKSFFFQNDAIELNLDSKYACDFWSMINHMPCYIMSLKGHKGVRKSKFSKCSNWAETWLKVWMWNL